MSTVTPAVSVLMVAHNGGRYLAPAVKSVLQQDWRDLELVLFDNGSSDGAVAAIARETADPRLRIIREERNHGIAEGTNRAFSHSRGRWIAIMDQDDLALPEKLGRQIRWLEARPAFGGVAARTSLIDAEDREVGFDFTLHDPSEHRVFSAFSQAANFGSHLFRREVLAAFPRRPEFPFSSDFDFIARAVERWEIAALPEVLFRYRVHPSQTTSQRRLEQLAAEGAIRILTACRRRGDPEPFASIRDWVVEWTALGRPADILRASGRRALALRLPILAAYQARRALGVGGPMSGVAASLGLCLAAMRSDPREAGHIARLFLTGPLRTYRLHPWPAS